MKKFLFLGCAFVLLYSGASAHMPHSSFGVSFGVFYSSLDSQGEWILVDRDVYAWRPVRVSDGWRPYTVGRWAWTDDGWYWVSAEPWGWATYHYGRWYYDEFYGWMWIPGYDWAPAWVEWRYGGDYIGWAPLGPYAVFSIHRGIHYATHWSTPHHWWSFVDCGYIGSPSVHRYVYRSEDNRRYIGRTRTSGNVRYVRDRIVSNGPGREDVERRSKVRIERSEIVDRDVQGERIVRNGDSERIETYRPRFDDRSGNGGERPERVRESDRRIALDTKRIDGHVRNSDDGAIRRTDEDRRITGKEESGRQPEDRRRSDRESVQPRRDTQTRKPEAINRQPQQRDERGQRQESMEKGKPQREQMRSAAPERTVRRQESSPDRNKRERSSRGRERK